jgi:hypothetical protein
MAQITVSISDELERDLRDFASKKWLGFQKQRGSLCGKCLFYY